jgi:hypothetical protein
MDHTFKLHGFPQAIITDRDWIFTSVGSFMGLSHLLNKLYGV